MKKAAIMITVLFVLLGSIAVVSADSYPKEIEVTLSGTPEVVNLGETVELTATAQKHGSSYVDAWENASKVFTETDAMGETYISKATFTAQKPGIYNISYTIKMTSGGSDTVFYKKVERIIKVKDHTLTGATIKDLEITPIYDAAGNITLYRAYGTVYAMWSDNTESPNGSVYFYFSPNEISKNVDATILIDGKQYNFIVYVSR